MDKLYICQLCTHNSVCKLKENFDKFYKNVKNQIKDHSDFEIEVRCKHYSSGISEIQPVPYNPPYNPLQPYVTWDSTGNCKDCWFTKRLTTGEPYVGDSPCQWCSNSPYKVTCTSSNNITTDKSDNSTSTTTKLIINRKKDI